MLSESSLIPKQKGERLTALTFFNLQKIKKNPFRKFVLCNSYYEADGYFIFVP